MGVILIDRQPQPSVRSIVGIIVIASLLVFIYAVMNLTQDAVQGQTAVPPLQHSTYDARLDELDREAIEQAYRNQITHLFQTWMKDGQGQPRRALIGTRQARKAYIDSMTELDGRSKQ